MTKFTDQVELTREQTFSLRGRDRLLTTGDAIVGTAPDAALRIAGTIRTTEGAGIDLVGDGLTLTITASARIIGGLPDSDASGSEGHAAITLGGDGVTFDNAGTLAGQRGVVLSGDSLSGTNTGEIRARGDSVDAGAGLKLLGSRGTFESSGAIFGSDIGVALGDGTSRGLTFVNSGTVEASLAARVSGARGVTLENTGTLFGSNEIAVSLMGKKAVLENSGRIEGDVIGSGARQFVRNSGDIEGIIKLGNGNDSYRGTRKATVEDGVYGNGGRDSLTGGKLGDLLDGGAGHDRISGNGGRDILFGGNGSDTLTGGKGNDTITGGAGADVFVFTPGQGNDKILDFKNGRDSMDLVAFDLRTIAAIKADGVLTDTDDGALLDLGIYGGGTVLLVGVTAQQIGAADFEPFA